MRKQYLTAQEVAEAMGVSAGKAYGRNRARDYIFGVRHREAARPFSPAAWQDL